MLPSNAHTEYLMSGPEALRERLTRWDLSFWGESQKAVYLRKGEGGKLKFVTDIAFISTQTRYTLYHRIPQFLFDCASGDANRIANEHCGYGLSVDLKMRHPSARLSYQPSDRFYKLPTVLSPLSDVLKHFHRDCDWICVPGTQAAFERAVTAAHQCERFYDIAVGVVESLQKAGCYEPGKFMCSRNIADILREAHRQRSEILALAPRNVKILGDFGPLCERVHALGLQMIDNFISSHREYAVDRICRTHLLPLGVSQSQTVEFWLHCMLARGEWLHHVERDPSCVERLQHALDEIRRDHRDTDTPQTLIRNLEYMVWMGRQMTQRGSLLNQTLARRLDLMLQEPYQQSAWTLNNLLQGCPEEVDRGLLAAIGEACFAGPAASAPPDEPQRLLRDEDGISWQGSEHQVQLQLMGEILRRPTVQHVPVQDSIGLSIPCYDSWKPADFALVQDHIFAAVLIARLERAGLDLRIIDQLWTARRGEARFSRMVWSMVDQYPAQLLPTARAIFQLAHQVAGKGHPVLKRVHDELLTCLGGLTTRDPALFNLEVEAASGAVQLVLRLMGK